MNKLLEELMSININEAKTICELVKDYNMENSQVYLNWQDELNKISVQ